MQPNKQSPEVATSPQATHKPKWSRFLFGLSVTVLAFSLGVAVGNGRLDFNRGSSANASLPGKLDYASVDEVYDLLRKNFDGTLSEEKILEGLKDGIAESTGDPYTEYFTAKEYKTFNDQLNGTGFSGIGAELGLDKDKNLIIVAPITGTPAAQAGVKPQDIVAEIDGKTTTGLSIEEGVSKIRGKKGTTVTLTLIRNKSESIELKIVRDDIKVPNVDSKVLEDGTGYLRISSFGNDTGNLAEEQAKQLKDKGIKSLIVDLRGNPGGVVDSAIQVAGLWLPRGTLIMQEKRDNTVIKTYTADGNNVLQGLKTVVLINEGSASASEIVAGALKDNKAATLIGAKSYGKGVVQGIEELDDGSKLKVTIARWFRPNGQNIDKKGIEPDQKVTVSDEDMTAGNDTQLKAAQAAAK